MSSNDDIIDIEPIDISNMIIQNQRQTLQHQNQLILDLNRIINE